MQKLLRLIAKGDEFSSDLLEKKVRQVEHPFQLQYQ